MSFFTRSANSSKSSFASTASSSPLVPGKKNPLFDSSNPSSPLYSPNYQVPVHSLSDSIAILLRSNKASSTSASKKPKAPKSDKPKESPLDALARLRGTSGHPSLHIVHV